MSPAFVRSELTEALVRFMRSHEMGELLTYKQLSKGVGVPIEPHNGCLEYARRVLEQEHNQVWIAERPRVGLRRLKDIEIADRLPRFHLKGARLKVNRGLGQSSIVDAAKLDIEEQHRFAVSSLHGQLVADALSKATARRIDKVARGSNANDLPRFSAMEWAVSLMPGKKTKQAP